jgi:hypothetical protein
MDECTCSLTILMTTIDRFESRDSNLTGGPDNLEMSVPRHNTLIHIICTSLHTHSW